MDINRRARSASFGSIFSIVALVTTLTCAPAAAQSTASQHLYFATQESNQSENFGGAIDGTLSLNIYSDGDISGYFRLADSGRLIDVLGSLKGTKIFLQIGQERPLYGDYVNGKISAYRESSRDLLLFTGMPESGPSA